MCRGWKVGGYMTCPMGNLGKGRWANGMEGRLIGSMG